jgi:serine/threonine protein kinase
VSPASVGGGRYILDQRIASGGMGEVWRGTENVADDESFRTRFASEAQHAAALHDSHIATVFDYGDDLDPATGRHTTYLVMELVDGTPLSQLVSRPIAPEQAALLVAQVAEGLAVAHRAGIVHRDVKPANLIVTPDGRIKITDFGIARARGAASITDTGTILGTPHYVAPEVAEGREATPASDIYSLGVVLYEALTGTKPFEGETPIAIALAHLREEPKPLPGSVPPSLRAIVESTLSRDPGARPPDADALAARLRHFAADPDSQPTAAMAAPPPVASTQVMPAQATGTAATYGPHPQEARRRTGWWLLAAAVVAVLLIAGIAYAATRDDGTDSDHTAGSTRNTTPAEETTATTPSTPTTPTTTTTEPPETVSVDPTAYIGRPVKDVEKELRDQGLVPVRGDEVPGGEKDTVADVSPTGDVAVGDQITLSVFTGKEEDGGEGPGNDGNGHGNGSGTGPGSKEN